MSVLELKEKIRKEVDSVDDADRLEAVLTMLRLPFRMDKEDLTAEELKMLEEREGEYQRGEVELIPWKESLLRTRAKYGL